MFKKGFLLLAFLICNISGKPIDDSYIRIGRQNASYKIHNKANFENAIKVCSEEDAELMTPSSQEEIDDIKSFKNGDAQSYWTGINTKDRTDRQFVTIRGDNFVPNALLQWDKNQPDNYRNEEACVEYRSNGKINDVPCKSDYKFICKKEDKMLKPLDEEIINFKYTIFERQNAAYKIHSKKNFEDAIKTCASEGAELMTPWSQEEVDDIKTFKNGDSDPYWAGINTKDRNDRQFVTLNGDKFIPLAFLQWANNQPDNYRNSEACVEYRSNGKINDVPCKNEYKFICKKPITPIKEEVVVDDKFVVFEKYNAAYKVYSKNTFENAALSCIQERAELFVPSSQEEFEDLMLFENDSDSYWVGILVNDIENRKFITVRGEKFIPNEFLQWDDYEPNNFLNRGENCVQLSSNRKLNDVVCDKEFRYICKKERKITKPIIEIHEDKVVDKKDVIKKPGSEIGKVGSIAYTLIERQNALYKIHEKDSFDYASMTCQEEGGDLFVPTSQQEMEDIKKFTNGYKEPYWIGVHIKDKNERQFVTVRGVKFVANAFLPWDKNQPDNYIDKNGFREDCVQIRPNGKLNDVPCQYEYKYICKKERK